MAALMMGSMDDMVVDHPSTMISVFGGKDSMDEMVVCYIGSHACVDCMCKHLGWTLCMHALCV